MEDELDSELSAIEEDDEASDEDSADDTDEEVIELHTELWEEDTELSELWSSEIVEESLLLSLDCSDESWLETKLDDETDDEPYEGGAEDETDDELHIEFEEEDEWQAPR